MSRRRVYQPKQSHQHLVYVRWHAADNRPIAAFYGPFDNVADAAGFEEAFTRDHLGVIDDCRIEDVIPVERMETFDA